MDDLILRSLQGRTGDLEERILRKWREKSPANEEAFRRTADLWRLEAHRAPPGAPPTRPRLQDIVEAAETRRRKGPSVASLHVAPAGRGPRRWPGILALTGLAAAALLVLSLGLPRTPASGPMPPLAAPAFAAAEFTTGADQTVTVNLNDGSYVRLAPSSRLRVEAGEGTREVVLDGRGYFAVASDPDRPFTVRTRLGDALVLGTRFEVDVRDENLRVVVSEGHVALSTGTERLDLRAGDVIYLASRGMPVLEHVENVQDLLDWPNGLLVFQATPLREVVRELTAHFGVRFEVEGEELADRTVTGWFDDESLEEVLSAVCRATGTRCVTGGGVVRMTTGQDP